MFRLTGGNASYHDLTAREAAAKARQLRRQGINDVELFREDGSRISLYALDMIVRERPEGSA